MRLALAATLICSSLLGQVHASLWRRVVAADRAAGLSAWITSTPLEGPVLIVGADSRAAPTVRLRKRDIRDVIFDDTGTGMFLLEAGLKGYSLLHLPVASGAEPTVIASDLVLPVARLAISGSRAIVMTEDAVYAESRGEIIRLFERTDSTISAVAISDDSKLIATEREGEIEVLDGEGVVLGNLGTGKLPCFVRGTHDVVFSRSDGLVRANESGGDVDLLFPLTAPISALRSPAPGKILFLEELPNGARHPWLLSLRSGVVRRVLPDDINRISSDGVDSRPATEERAATRAPAGTRAAPEPQDERAGFFVVDTLGQESRAPFERDGYDSSLYPEEARVFEKLVNRFLAGIQWPLPKESAFAPFIGADDEPLRCSSQLPHRGLDIGARLLHTSTGSIGHYAADTRVYPIYRGGVLHRDVTMTVSSQEEEGVVSRPWRYALLQEVTLREESHLLRLYLAYVHVRPLPRDDMTWTFPTDAQPPEVLTGDEPIGTLDPFKLDSVYGGFLTSDPSLLALGITKGCHVHLGIGGLYESFNAGAECSTRKLQFVRDRLIPALKR